MIEAVQSHKPSALRRVFYGPSELRAGWRLLIFLAIVVTFINASNMVVGQTLPGHLLNSSSSGAAWLSGGTVGPEGSVLCTLMIVVVWLICAGWLRGVKYHQPPRIVGAGVALD
jgi:hypothetical protein